MSNFDVIKDSEGKEYLTFDSSELYDDRLIGNKSEDFDILKILGEGSFGQVFKVISKLNNKVYAMKKLNLKEIQRTNQKAYELALNEINFLQELDNAHIIKYYKNFREGDYLYIIIEYAANGDLDKFIKAHKVFNNPIPEELLWNIILQCMEALSYIHNKNVIHRDIKPFNIFMDNNLFIKIGDFGCSAIKFENNNTFSKLTQTQVSKMLCGDTRVYTPNFSAKEIDNNEKNYDSRVDVYSMGITFCEMICLENPETNNFQVILNKLQQRSNIYSKELLDIIPLMIEPEKEKRKTSHYIYHMIEKIYNRRFFKNSSIDSIIRCLFSFNGLTNQMLNLPYNMLGNKPITKAYVDCLNNILKPSLDEWINSIRYFRKILGFQNPKLSGSKEIDPRIVFAFIIKQLHLELNQSQFIRKDNHLIISGEEISKTNKLEMMIRYVNDFSQKVNSIISSNFIGLMKTKNICNICKIVTYSFNSYFFVTFNLENILQNNFSVSKINLEYAFKVQNQLNKKKQIHCSKCLNKTLHICNKQFYSFPNLLVISIQRGASYQYKASIDIKQQIDLTEYDDFKSYKKIYQLIGVLKRKVNNGKESYISICYFNQKWWECEDSYVNETLTPCYFDPDGDTMMLFYEKMNNF